MALVELSIPAQDDLFEIRRDLESKSLNVSQRCEELFDQAFGVLAKFPRAGRERPEIDRRVRSWAVRPYLILYELHATDVKVLRVVHGARDLPTLILR